MAEKNVSHVTPNNKEQPGNGLPLRSAPKSVWRDKRLWVVVILFAFLGIGGGLIPAGKIPLFSSLVKAMGFSQSEADEMTLLKALLKWQQKRQEENADKQAELTAEEIAANARASAALSLALTDEEAAQNERNLASSLISMRKLNLDQRQKGGKVDAIRGAVKQVAGEEIQDNAVKVSNIDVPNVNTEANANTKAEVFFGQDASATLRDEQHGFNSTKILTKIENPHIAGGTSSTWLTDTIDKAMLADANLGQLTKELNTKGHGVDFDDIKNIGKDRPHRDLNYAWLTGQATYRTPNRLLKKTLAAAGFNGEDMPKKVFDSSLSGIGVGIDPNDVNQDAKGIKERMAKEDNCRNKILLGTDKKDAYDNLKGSIKNLAAAFPKKCTDVLADNVGDFNALLANIRNQCQAINQYYSDLQQDCKIAYTPGKCPSLDYSQRFQKFKSACETKCNQEYERYLAGLPKPAEGEDPPTPVSKADFCNGTKDIKGVYPETEGKDLSCGNDISCGGQTAQDEVRYQVTGYDTDGALEQSTGVNTDEDGKNIAGQADYMASQSVEDLITTLQGRLD